MTQTYLKNVIFDYTTRKNFLRSINHICNQNNIKLPFTKKKNKEGMIIIPDKVAFDKIYEHILVRFYNSSYRYSGLKNYPYYQHFKSIYNSQGWEMPKEFK